MSRLGRRRRRELTDDRPAFDSDYPSTIWRSPFIREPGDEKLRDNLTASIIAKPIAGSQDPTSLYLLIHFWMHQPSYRIFRTYEIKNHFRTTFPYAHYAWSLKVLGDLNTILITASLNRPRTEQPVFESGRDGKGSWQYVMWDRDAAEWLDALSGAASALARVKRERWEHEQPTQWSTGAGMGRAVEAMATERLRNYTYNFMEHADDWFEPRREIL